VVTFKSWRRCFRSL